jgi:ribonuclease HI
MSNIGKLKREYERIRKEFLDYTGKFYFLSFYAPSNANIECPIGVFTDEAFLNGLVERVGAEDMGLRARIVAASTTPNIQVLESSRELNLHEYTVYPETHIRNKLRDCFGIRSTAPAPAGGEKRPVPPAQNEKGAEKKSKMIEREYTLYFDGGSRGNGKSNSIAGAGYVIESSAGDFTARGSIYLGSKTNNQAEYSALEHGLIQAQKHQLRRLRVRGDSELVIKQLNGAYQAKDDTLREYRDRIRKYAKDHFDDVVFEHVYREQNKDADKLANTAMNSKKTTQDACYY